MRAISSYIGMLILPGCLLLFSGGVAGFRRLVAFLRLSEMTTGVIVDIVCGYDAKNKRVYLPIFEFRLIRKIRFQAVVGSRCELSFKICETIGVRYLPEKPKIALINTFVQLYGDALGMIGAGVLFTLAPLFLLGELRWAIMRDIYLLTNSI
jgi:hypothetical protein